MILHMDMDAFFASVEQLDRPELKGKPVIVGGNSQRAVVSTASYEARKFGVRSAMPVFQAKRLCPHGIFLPGRLQRYHEISQRIFKVLEEFSPLIEPVSIDEAYVDLTGCERGWGPPHVIASHLKKRVWEAVHLTCSVGIAPVKFLSKIASDLNKPNGITIISPGEMEAFIKTLPIGKVPGVGKTTLKQMKQLGIRYLGDIRTLDEKVLNNKLGTFGGRLKELSWGLDRRTVSPNAPVKSVSSETTLEKDTLEMASLRWFLLMHSEDVARQLRVKRVKARTVTLKITFSDFRQITRRTTLKIPTSSSGTLFSEAVRLMKKEPLTSQIRLIGMGGTGLIPENQPVQTDLFSTEKNKREKWEALEKTVDAIIARFGRGAVKRATLTRHQPL